jgi:hypothetical protein
MHEEREVKNKRKREKRRGLLAVKENTRERKKNEKKRELHCQVRCTN